MKKDNNIKIKIPGLPSDFEEVISRLQERDISKYGGFQLAKDQSPDDLLQHAVPVLVHPDLLSVGQNIEGKGIYLGIWTPKDENKKSLGKVFDLYTAPTDIMEAGGGRKLLATFNNAVRHVGELQNWYGHDGINFESHREIFQAIRDGKTEWLENWFIPPVELVCGKDVNRKRVADPNLISNMEVGALKDTFDTIRNNPRGVSMCRYWTTTTDRNPATPSICAIDFSRDGHINWCKKNNASDMYSIRPVRAELRV